MSLQPRRGDPLFRSENRNERLMVGYETEMSSKQVCVEAFDSPNDT